jgi:hypothetical protein
MSDKAPFLAVSREDTQSFVEKQKNRLIELCLNIYLSEEDMHTVALSYFYFYFGFVMGSWISMYPIIETELGISSSDFGVYLISAGYICTHLLIDFPPPLVYLIVLTIPCVYEQAWWLTRLTIIVSLFL